MRWHNPIAGWIQSIEAILETEILDLLASKPWFRGICVLIADAIHPTTPNLEQWASLGLESAVLLAEEVN